MNYWALIRPALYFVLGVSAIVYGLIHQPAPESKLLLFEGVPEKVQHTTHTREKRIEFYLGRMWTDYPENAPKYNEVATILEAKEPVKVWVDNEDYKDGYGTFYKMSAGDKEIVTYADAVQRRKNDNQFWMIIGSVLVGVSVFLFKRRKTKLVDENALQKKS